MDKQWNTYDRFNIFFSREKKILKFNLYKKNNISLLKLYFKKNQNMTIHFVKRRSLSVSDC